MNHPIVMLDFETTGLSPAQGDRITEVAALRIERGRVTDRYVSLVNCNRAIPSFITHLTGITQGMVDAAPPVSRVMPELLSFIGTAALAAHNASFDLKFLVAESARLRIAPQHQGLICSLKLTRRLFPGLPNYRLGTIATELDLQFLGDAHRAEADAEVAAQLLLCAARHLDHTYQLKQISPKLFEQINRLSAAKVPAFLQKTHTAAGSAP